jgi:surfeit locus 1 family protein
LKHKLSFSIFVYSFILIFISLGIWQLYRLEWKLNLISEINNAISSEPIQFNSNNIKNFQKVSFNGKIDNEKIIYLYNLNEEGEPGFDIINPINIENKNFLINRGWVKISDKNKPFITNNENFVGILREKSKSSYFKPDNDLPNNYWFKLEDVDLEKYTGLEFSNYIIYLSDSNSKKIPKPKNISANLSNNHLKYALTWFSLAISIFLIYLYFRKKNY